MTIWNSGGRAWGTSVGRRWGGVAVATAALAGTAVIGCSTAHPTAVTQPLATATPVTSASPADDLDAVPFTPPPPPAPAVNVFGELNGVPRGAVRPIGEEGFQQHSFADEGYDADVAVDPSGKNMVFASTRHNEHSALYLQRTDGTAVTRLTSDDSDNAFPTFSPDGRQIAFCSTRTGVWNVYTMDTDGRSVVTVTTGSSQCVHPTYSPDGTRLCYSSLATAAGSGNCGC